MHDFSNYSKTIIVLFLKWILHYRFRICWSKKVPKLLLFIPKLFFLFIILSSPSLSSREPSLGQFHSNVMPLIASENLKEGRQKKEKVHKKTNKKKRKKTNKFYFWGSASTSNSRDEFLLSKLKGTQFSGLFGIDYKINSTLKVGANYSHNYSRSQSPIGSANNKKNSDNFFLFAMYYFTPKFFANLVLGYSYSPTQIRKSQNLFPVFSKTNMTILSATPSLNLKLKHCDIEGSFQLGYDYNYSFSKRGIDSRGHIVNGKNLNNNAVFFFADIAYFFKKIGQIVNKIAPYVQGGIDYNLQKTPLMNQRRTKFFRAQEGYKVGTGLRFYFANDVTLSAGWQHIGGHSGLSSNTYIVTLRVGVF